MRAVAAAPRHAYARVIASACAWWAGEHARAAGHIEILRGLAPTFTIGQFLQTFGAGNDAVVRLSEALKVHGVPR